MQSLWRNNHVELWCEDEKVTISGAIIVSILSTESMMNYHAAKAKVKKVEHQPKNIIMMVMDGTSSTATTLARWYKGAPLTLGSNCNRRCSYVFGGISYYRLSASKEQL